MSPTKTPTPKSTTLPRNALTSPLFSQAEAYRRYALTHIPEHPIKRLDELLRLIQRIPIAQHRDVA